MTYEPDDDRDREWMHQEHRHTESFEAHKNALVRGGHHDGHVTFMGEEL